MPADALDSASQTATALLGAKTFDEVVQLNTELAKASLEALLARSAKLSEMGVSLASGAFAPARRPRRGGVRQVHQADGRLSLHAGWQRTRLRPGLFLRTGVRRLNRRGTSIPSAPRTALRKSSFPDGPGPNIMVKVGPG